jgi:two-component system sensor histidine kinase KdpD
MAPMNETTVALLFLLGVLVVAAVSTRAVAVVASLVAFICYNFFFLQPVGTFSISKGDDLLALFVLLAVSLIGSHLSHLARRRAEESLALGKQRNEAEMARRSAEIKSALVASLSHDVKTPLTALTVASGNLNTPDLSDDLRREQLHIIGTELDRLKRLFENMIDLASVEARAMTLQPEWVTPADLIEAARRQVESRLRDHPLQMIGEANHDLILLDPRLTSSALAHVLENAAQYSPQGSPIEIAVSITAGQLHVAVRDHGPGVQAPDLTRVFERFYRGSGALRDTFRSGMGLAITRGLLEQQEGRIGVANHPNGGAVFTLDVPATTRPVSDASVDVA